MRIIKVNLTDHTIREEAFHQEDYGFFGGRGLIARFLTDYCDPLCDALGPDNPLIFATGYFSGTILTTSNRLSIGAKSPLTGGIKESNSGGTFARRMTDHQIKIILFEGQSPDWVYLYIDKEGNPSLVDAAAYMGMNTYPVGQAFRKTYNDRIAIAAIGTAGEHLGLVSSIMVTEMNSGLPCRAAARGGMGAVMGSKRLKAVVIEHSDNPYYVKLPPKADKEFRALNKKIVEAIKTNPLTGQTMPAYGSAAGVDTTGKMGALPWNNFNGKFTPGWERIGTQQWRKNLIEQGGHSIIPCQPGCIVRCSNEYCDKNGNYLSAGIEYETVALCGSNIGVFDTDIICTLDRLCDDMGMDTIDIGCALGVMMDQGVLAFGDGEGAIDLVRNMFAPNSRWGNVLKDGCAAVADALGVPQQPGRKRVPVSKRQAFAAYDPRVIRGYGLTWERGPMGADHTSGSAATYIPTMTPEQQADYSLAVNCTCDCFMCLFSWSAVNFSKEARPAIARMAGILAGMEEGPDVGMIQRNGMEILQLEYAFNAKAGIVHENDRFYGGKDNFMYSEPHEATRSPFWSIQNGPLPTPPTPPTPAAAPQAQKTNEVKE